MQTDRIRLVSHPLLDHSLTILRDRETRTADFRRHAGIVSTVLLIEAMRALRVEVKTIETPLEAMAGRQLSGNLMVVPVLRAGLAMLFAAQELLLDVPVGFLGLERDEETAVAREYYRKFPVSPEGGWDALVLDPMLATGGSLEETITAVLKRGCKHITLACIVSAPEGIERIMQAFPSVALYTAAIDTRLNDRKYIVPGLGDFGDRYFGT